MEMSQTQLKSRFSAGDSLDIAEKMEFKRFIQSISIFARVKKMLHNALEHENLSNLSYLLPATSIKEALVIFGEGGGRQEHLSGVYKLNKRGVGDIRHQRRSERTSN